MGKVTIWADGLMAALTTAPFTSMPTAMRRNYTARACATHARAWLSLADAPGRAHARHGGLCRAPRACGVAGATPGIAKPHSCTHTRRFGGVPAAKSHRIVQKRKNGAPPPMKMGTTASPWHYDVAAADAIRPDNQRRTAILRYASWAAVFPFSQVVRFTLRPRPFRSIPGTARWAKPGRIRGEQISPEMRSRADIETARSRSVSQKRRSTDESDRGSAP